MRRKGVEKGKADQPFADIFRHRAVAGAASMLMAHPRKMERLVVERRVDAARLEKFNQTIARLPAGHDQIIHVICLLAVFGNDRPHHAVLGSPILQGPVVFVPDGLAKRLYALPTLQLGEQEGGQQI